MLPMFSHFFRFWFSNEVTWGGWEGEGGPLSCIAGRTGDIAVPGWRQSDTPGCREGPRSSSPGSRTWRTPPCPPQSFNTDRQKDRISVCLIDWDSTERLVWWEALLFPGLSPVCRRPALLGTGEVAGGVWEAAAVQRGAGVPEGFLLGSVVFADIGAGGAAVVVLSKPDREEKTLRMILSKIKLVQSTMILKDKVLWTWMKNRY